MQEVCLQVHLASDKEHNCKQDQVLDHPELTTPSPKLLPQLAENKSYTVLQINSAVYVLAPWGIFFGEQSSLMTCFMEHHYCNKVLK